MTKTTPPDLQDETKLQQRIAAGSHDPEDYCKLAGLLVSAGRYEEAVALYHQALNLPVTDLQKARLSIDLGWLFYEVGEPVQGQTLAQSAIRLLSSEQESPEVLLVWGLSQSLLAHCVWFKDDKSGAEMAQAALKWLERIVTEAPNFEEIGAAYYAAARLHNLLGNAKEAIELCEKCLQLELGDMERLSCLIAYSEALRLDERFKEAEKALEEALRYAKTDKVTLPLVYFTLGLIQRSTHRLAEARETFEKVLEALQAHPYLKDDSHFLTQVYWNLGELDYGSEKLEEALRAFQKILAYHPEADTDHRNALLWLGYCYQAMRDHSKAVGYFKELLASPHASETEKASARKSLAWNLGKLHYESGDCGQAAAAFEEVLTYLPSDDPDRPNTLVWLGHCYLATEAQEKARDCFEEVLTSSNVTETDKASALVGLGDIYLEAGQYEEAAAAAKEALVYQPENEFNHWNTLLRLGHAYFGRDYQKARECYERILASPHAAEADKDSARKNLTRSLANLYYEAGQYEEATAAFEEVLSYYPEDVPHHCTALLWLGRCHDATEDCEKARDCYEQVLASPHASEEDKASAREGLARLPQLPKKTLH